MDDFVPGVAAALGGLALIFWRRQFAASTVRQQNRFWRTKYGPAQVAFSEQAAILIGVFSLVMAVSFWLDLFWPPVIVLAGGVLGLNVLRLRRRRSDRPEGSQRRCLARRSVCARPRGRPGRTRS
jgi:F0F1-type ATP synthase assembly protein I